MVSILRQIFHGRPRGVAAAADGKHGWSSPNRATSTPKINGSKAAYSGLAHPRLAHDVGVDELGRAGPGNSPFTRTRAKSESSP